jgi:hypothetical protein
MKFLFAVAAAVMISATACASRQVVPHPASEITLEQAMRSVGVGLRELREEAGEPKTGLMPSSVDITFNVTATGKDDGKLVIERATLGSQLEATRGNTITLTLSNILFAEKGVLLYDKDAKQLGDIISTIKEHLSVPAK